MKKVTLLCGLLVALCASNAFAAAGLGLRWSNCIGDAGTINKAFACSSNAGTNLAVGTFETSAAGLAQTSGNEIVIDVASAGATLPAWWQMKNPGTCRSAALTMNAVASAAAVNCADWAVGAAAGGIGAYNIGARGPNTARLVAALAVPGDGLIDLFGGQEYFSFNLLISNVKTVGTGLCDGCNVPVCIVFNSLLLTTPIAANNVKLSGAANGTDGNFCTWQGGAGVVVGAATGCPQATPTQNKTWGQVKSLYR